VIVGLALGGALLLEPLAPASTASSAADRTRQESVGQEAARQDKVLRGASLKVSPKLYVGGQRLTYKGNLGRKGRRHIHLQWHMGRPGDSWRDVEGSGGRSYGDGRFKLRYISPSMFGIKVRVVGKGGLKTPARTLDPQSQELQLWVSNPVRAGYPFTVHVDTTPTIPRRSDLPTPAFAGRTLTLQKRFTGDSWTTVGTTRTDSRGMGSFTGVEWDGTGRPVYRVRQENFHVNGHRIGWFPSYPTYFATSGGRGSVGRSATAAPTGSSGDAATARGKRPPKTAANSYGWGRSLWDFAWEWGESLSSRPYRGTDKRGRWADSSTGTGRVAKKNGELGLESQPGYDGPGDWGTTRATLRGQPMRYGRWETKLRINSSESSRDDFGVVVELVPDGAPDTSCQTVTVARVEPHSATLHIGATAKEGSRRWTGTRSIGSLIGASATFAAEVTKSRISWFVNGRVIATLQNKDAVPGVPLTLRLSLEGGGPNQEMNRTAALFDWQRGYSLTKGRSLVSGQGLASAGSC
jgi:hypothetical protein